MATKGPVVEDSAARNCGNVGNPSQKTPKSEEAQAEMIASRLMDHQQRDVSIDIVAPLLHMSWQDKTGLVALESLTARSCRCER